MTQQVMVNGLVFGLSGSDVVFGGRRLSPRTVRKLPTREKDLVRRAVDMLAGLSADGSVLVRRYSNL